ncbi:hypothetical protein NBRC116584_07150 [Hydrogenophaga sp. 5NK40-0174]
MSPEDSPQFDLPFAGAAAAVPEVTAVPGYPVPGSLGKALEQAFDVISAKEVEPARTLVLLPYTQLLEPARRLWASLHPAGFPPRFETTRSWAMATGPYVASPTDWTGDAARDALVAQTLIRQSTQQRLNGTMRAALVERVLEGSRQLAPLAAAQAPALRSGWSQSHKALVSSSMQSLYWESLSATVALTWVGLSSFVTDWLWMPQSGPGVGADCLLVIPGLQHDPLTLALVKRWGEAALVLPGLAPRAAELVPAQVRAISCADVDEEARQAAACAVTHINAGRSPVALVAQDRVLTRRVSALLSGAGVRLRDETGWKLSTTHAAAQLMALLRAAQSSAKVDDVLDFLKLCEPSAPWLLESMPLANDRVAGDDLSGGGAEGWVCALEARARQYQVSRWSSLIAHPDFQDMLPSGLMTALQDFSAPKPLVRWLEAMHQWLAATGWEKRWAEDAAGERVMASLRLDGDGAQEWRLTLGDELLPQRMSLGGFTAWVRQALESATFVPGDDRQAQVVVLPMAQLPGRVFAACVMAGCDEAHLSASPDPVGTWTQEQRETLGLPDRSALATQAREAWRHVLGQAWLDVLWRTAEGSEHLGPAVWVQDLQTQLRESGVPSVSPSACQRIEVLAEAVERQPAPEASGLRVPRVSATHYQDLRDCPYRYFAIRLLDLQPVQELEQAPGKREWGTVLHAVLRRFHEERRDGSLAPAIEAARLDELLLDEMSRAGLASDGQAGEFHPFVAAWPRVRDGYLGWLSRTMKEGGGSELVFQQGEARFQGRAGPYELVGVIDRIDRGPDGCPWVIDYKTGSLQSLREKVADPTEDTQTAFYAALLGNEPRVRAAYLCVSDARDEGARKRSTTMVEQADVMAVRDDLLTGIAADLSRIEGGHPLKAMGEGSVCDYCQARGLCRRDFWEQVS